MSLVSDPSSLEIAQATGRQPKSVMLLGNPNVGKSVIFGLLTGRYVTVSNYPGTTVTFTRGKTELNETPVEIIDTPGVNSLLPLSEDEQVTRDMLLHDPIDSIVQVADAKNLRSGLFLSTQLAEMGLPFMFVLNMTDEARDLGLRLDVARLKLELGVPVVQTVATRRKGFDQLRDQIQELSRSRLRVQYPAPLETAIKDLEEVLPEAGISSRSLALMILAGDSSLDPWLWDHINASQLSRMLDIRRNTAVIFGESLGTVINRARLRTVDSLLAKVEERPQAKPGSFLHALGSWSMHPVWGVPFLVVILAAMYQFVGVFGAGISVDFLENQFFGRYISPWSIQAADALFRFPHQHLLENGVVLPDYSLVAGVELTFLQQVGALIHDLFVGPYGQVTMALSYALALILPIVSTFFLAFGILEDSGYLPRLAVMVNRLFRVIGLNGKAVLPMVLGLGCTTMATLTTRILETKKERVLVTLLLALGVPCSAQLGVILGMMQSLSLAGTVIWGGSVLLIMLAVGWLGSRLVPGEHSDFVLELPPIRRPQFGNLVVKTFARIEWYLREAVPLFLLGTFVLFVADRLKLLGALERAASPVVQGVLGLPAKATEAFLIGFLRRDYGAAGLYDLARDGGMDSIQLLVSMVTITLFVPCVATSFVMIKERGMKTALGMVAVIVPIAFLVGGLLNLVLRAWEGWQS